MDTNFATSPSDSNHHPLRRGRAAIAAMLIACISMNSAFATGLAQRAAQQTNAAVEVTLNEVAVDQQLIQSIDALDEGQFAELQAIYVDAAAAHPGEASTSDQQKSWKTVLAKAILKSSAFKAALRAASERAYVWYMGHINPVLAAMDQVTSWEVVGIATALGAVGVPPSWAKIIAKVLAFFL